MSDYLTNIISTNFSLVQTLRPRVAALFEPASSGELNAGEHEMYESTRDQTAAPVPRAEAHDVPPMPLVVVERDARSQTVPEAHADSQQTPKESAATPRNQESMSAINSMISRLQLAPRAEAGGSPSSSPVYKPLPRVEGGGPPSSSAVSETSRETIAPSSQSPRAVVIQPEVRTVVQAPPTDRSPMSPPAPATAPVIHVTIGHLEVRAVQTPAPFARKKKEEPPTISLEDYLKGRER